jgi:hypothetical protein
MIVSKTILRVARPTDNLDMIAEMYRKGLGFQTLAEFSNHGGFDGVVLGIPNESYHIEFTHHHGVCVGKAPTEDNLLVFYIEQRTEWEQSCVQAEQAGFTQVASYNPYWDACGKTYQDIDGYRIVFQNTAWLI